jgi:ferredoxin
MTEAISKGALLALVDEWIGGTGVAVGPRRVKPDLVQYAPLDRSGSLELDGYIHPANSVKQFIFPRHETLYCYKCKGKDVELTDASDEIPRVLVVGARPCDAAALAIVDKVFNWDVKDELYNRRREATTVVTLACREHDSVCFCTSVGLGPAAERGSDALLLGLGDGNYEVRCVTEKGKALFAGRTEASSKTATVPPGPPKKFEPGHVEEFLKENFENPIWKDRPLRCIGCGGCAFTCPTCHCFDIQDERTADGGKRVRNWDGCQFAQFTLHASGHNPRAGTANRQRQRIQHKFRIYPEKFGDVLCTGCGNCVRNCPVRLGVLGVLEAIEAEQAVPVAK